MSNSKEFNILQYNTNKSGEQVQIPFMQQLDPETHHIVAIQEPWLNTQTKGRVKSFPGYYSVQPAGEVPRVAIYVSKSLAQESWEAQMYSEDLIGVRINQGDQGIHILNCYNPSGPTTDRELGTLPLAREAVNRFPQDQCLLLGDFNLHHQRWGAQTATNQHWASGFLIEMTEQAGLEILLEPGTVTWERNQSIQTIDLFFASSLIQEQITQYRVCTELEPGSDHLS